MPNTVIVSGGTGALSRTVKAILRLRIWNLLVALACVNQAAIAHAQSVKLSVIYVFSSLAGSTNVEGAYPQSCLAFGPDGCLYGTTSGGGSNGFGTIFRVTTNGALVRLGTFSDSDPAGRFAGLALGPDGNLYGTTQHGGVNGTGSVFQVATNGGVSTVYSFSACPGLTNVDYPYTNSDGASPNEGLTLDQDGNLYGTTIEGGAYGQGTFFNVTTNGNPMALSSYDFEIPTSDSERVSIPSSLTLGQDSSFYGATAAGGTNGTNTGVIFKVTTNGVITTLCLFNSGFGIEGGWFPSPLALGPDGNFYGTTSGGGSNGMGTAYQVTPGGLVSTLVNFGGTNGDRPLAALTLGMDGNLYGTTSYGGTNSYFGGTIFRLTTNGQFTSLYSFSGASNEAFTNANGAIPLASLTLAPDGSFYGTTFEEGPNATGTIFKLTILQPTLAIQSIAGNVLLSWNDPTYGLQTATNLGGIFTNIPFATSPFTTAILSNSQFFRLVRN
jgi:uncharacterized repeat protein (TIGR03803 family)